jgi:hypothetical protein
MYLPPDFSRGHGADVAQADVSHHPFESAARDQAGGRTAEVFVHDLNLAPAQAEETVAHCVLQALAFEVVCDLIGR